MDGNIEGWRVIQEKDVTTVVLLFSCKLKDVDV